MSLSQSPWARGWMQNQIDDLETKKRATVKEFEKVLLLLIALGAVVMISLQVGISEGRQEGMKLGQDIGYAAAWSEHYDQFASVKWVFEEAQLRRMYEKR